MTSKKAGFFPVLIIDFIYKFIRYINRVYNKQLFNFGDFKN